MVGNVSLRPAASRPATSLAAATLAAAALSVSLPAPARADINITPGPANPDYPASEPDPWNVIGNLDLQGSDLSIDGGSEVIVTGTLLTGETTLFNSEGLSFLLTQGTLGIGQSLITPTDNTIFNIESDNSTLTAAGNATIGSGGNATFTLNLANNSVFDITGAGVFGADDSSVSISATDSAFSVGGAATFAGAGSDVLVFLENGSFDIGGDATFASGDNSNVNIVAIDSQLNVGGTLTGIRGAGSASNFFVTEGQVTIGGDWLAGNAPASTGNSTSVITGIDTTIDVAGNLDAGLGPDSSNDLTWTNVTFTGGGDFVFGGLGSGSMRSVAGFTAVDSSITVNGHFNATLGFDSATVYSLDGVTFIGGSDFVIAGVDESADSSSAAFTAMNSSITAAGGFRSVLGSGSTMILDFGDVALDFGGDFVTSIGGDSTHAFTLEDTSLAANHALFRSHGQSTSSSYRFADASVLDLAGDFRVENTGDDSDLLFFMQDVTGSVDGSVVFQSSGGNTATTVALVGIGLGIGNDLHFDLETPAGSTTTLAAENVVATIGNDLVFDLPRSGDGSRTVAFANVDLQVDRDVVIGEGTDFAASGSAGGSPGPLDASIIPTDIGGRLVVKGSLDLNDTFSRDAGLAVEAPGSITTSYTTDGTSGGTSGSGTPDFVDADFTGPIAINGGTLTITQSAGGDPALYARSTAIATSGGGATGGFDTVLTPDFGDGTALAITYEADGVVAQRALRGDANLDQSVNLIDFLVLSQGFGGTGTWTDGNFDNGNGAVDGDDLADLIANYDDGRTPFGPATPGDVQLLVDPTDGSLSLAGAAELQGVAILSGLRLLVVDDDELNGFDTRLAGSFNQAAFGATGDAVTLAGNLSLGTGYRVNAASFGIGNDLTLLYGVEGSDTLFVGTVGLIPEPTTAGVVGLGAGLLLGRRRQRAAV